MLVLSQSQAPADIGHSIATCLRSWAAGDVDRGAFARVEEWLEEGERLFDGEGENLLDRNEVSTQWNDEVLREELELDEDALIDDRLRVMFARDRLEGAWTASDADIHPGLVRVKLCDDDGLTLVLGALIKGYSFSEISIDWVGPFTTEEKMVEDMGVTYLFEGTELSDEQIMASWGWLE